MPKILIVDDEVEITRIVEKFLSKQGYEITALTSGEKALETISLKQDFDLMVLDVKMPNVTGIDIMRALRAQNIKTPVIILSGSIGVEENVDVLRELGYDEGEVLYKPIDLFDLLKKIQEKLEKD